MESEAKAGSPRQTAARACRQRGGRGLRVVAASQAQGGRGCPGSHPEHGDTLKLPGHAEISTAMIYTHVLNRDGKGVQSPLDALA